ncbi:hypothetical protein [Nitrososphaera viennensis]|uniref:Uncharacterized protein n=2 Tax=Nitrososphaera viennensis TaxID=1034015 RepID=A0A060HM90_9ARCH|nr:hypothetical protein [Nitrososphaera viennensis]AIC16593.1 exported protein of unknown function [Nitrososphaera viennensis EN76]UVS68522.1 hypothetical protein NWT39_11495 [Nitrososphaera viennensis]
MKKTVIIAIIAGIVIAGSAAAFYFGSRRQSDILPNENPLPSGPSPHVTASIEGLSEKPYSLNNAVSFQAKVTGKSAQDDCGSLHLVAESKRSDGSYAQVSDWNATLRCSMKASDGTKANFEYLFPQEGNYNFTPESLGDYRITATVTTPNDGTYSTYKTISVSS